MVIKLLKGLVVYFGYCVLFVFSRKSESTQEWIAGLGGSQDDINIDNIFYKMLKLHMYLNLSNPAQTKEDQIDNLLKERRSVESLEMSVDEWLHEGDFKVLKRTIWFIIWCSHLKKVKFRTIIILWIWIISRYLYRGLCGIRGRKIAKLFLFLKTSYLDTTLRGSNCSSKLSLPLV